MGGAIDDEVERWVALLWVHMECLISEKNCISLLSQQKIKTINNAYADSAFWRLRHVSKLQIHWAVMHCMISSKDFFVQIFILNLMWDI